MLISTRGSGAEDRIPPLRPPHAELHPTFWDQYGTIAFFATLLIVVAVAVLINWLRRPRPVEAVPPEVLAHQALSALTGRPEDASLAFEVSRVLRHYLYSALELPPNELTTTELTKVLRIHAISGPNLAAATGDFLRQCDERKFAPTSSSPSKSMIAVAGELIAQFESHRQQMLRAAPIKPPPVPAARPAA